MVNQSLIDSFNKDTKKMEGVSLTSAPPKWFLGTGSYIINKTISGSYTRGLGQGRMCMFAGPSGAGKSFLVGNTIKEAQRQGFGVLVIDSENALDSDFLAAIGANPEAPDFLYRGVSSITQAVNIVQKFLKLVRETKTEQKYLIVVDSLDMLSTESAIDAYESGETKGDQGQHAKQLKAALTPIMHDIKDLPVVFLATKQVYQTQDPIEAKNPATQWKLSESIRYPFSQIVLVSKLLLKNDTTKIYDGIRLRVFGFKTRFTKPYQQAMVEVPYDVGMNPFTGLLEAAESVGLVTRAGAWYTFGEKKFQSKSFSKYQDKILEALIEKESGQVLDLNLDEYDTAADNETVSGTALTTKRAAKAAMARAAEQDE